MKKSFLSALVIGLISFNVSAATATSAVKNLIDSGDFKATDCSVKIEIKNDLVLVNVETNDANLSFGLLDSLKNYSVDQKGDLRASQSLRFPKFENGGMKHLTIRKNATTEGAVDVMISEVLFDHRGNDVGQFASCTVTK